MPHLESAFCHFLLYCDDESLYRQIHQSLWSADREREAAAVPLAREFLRRSPASAERWCTLGDAFLRAGGFADARHAYSQALERGPNSPPVLMRAAQFQLELGNIGGYLSRTGRVLSLVENYDAVIFDGYHRIVARAERVIREGLADRPAALFRYYEYLSERGEMAEAEVVRNWLARRPETVLSAP